MLILKQWCKMIKTKLVRNLDTKKKEVSMESTLNPLGSQMSSRNLSIVESFKVQKN